MEKYYWIFEFKLCVCVFKKKNEKRNKIWKNVIKKDFVFFY